MHRGEGLSDHSPQGQVEGQDPISPTGVLAAPPRQPTLPLISVEQPRVWPARHHTVSTDDERPYFAGIILGAIITPGGWLHHVFVQALWKVLHWACRPVCVVDDLLVLFEKFSTGGGGSNVEAPEGARNERSGRSHSKPSSRGARQTRKGKPMSATIGQSGMARAIDVRMRGALGRLGKGEKAVWIAQRC